MSSSAWRRLGPEPADSREASFQRVPRPYGFSRPPLRLFGDLQTYIIPAPGSVCRFDGRGPSARADALVPPFVTSAPRPRQSCRRHLLAEFHNLGAADRTGIATRARAGRPASRRLGKSRPCVGCASAYMLAALIVLLFPDLPYHPGMAHAAIARLIRRVRWDGGVRRLLPEMTLHRHRAFPIPCA